MTLNELRSTLQAILEAEQAPHVDWAEVKRLCDRALNDLKRQDEPDYTDEFVHVFLEDPQLRQEDRDYARLQHDRLRNWLEGSEIIAR
jgi:hypothetical protein